MIDAPHSPNNDAWLKHCALADLHALLFRDLPYGLSMWLSPEHSDFEFLMEYTARVSLARVLNKLDTYEGLIQFLQVAFTRGCEIVVQLRKKVRR